jgi:hypothetical protein
MRYQDLGPDYYERQAAARRKIAQRGASPHTIASYRDTLRLLFA